MGPQRRDLRRAVSSSKLGGPPSPHPSATGKIGPVSTSRTEASTPQPQAATGAGDNRTQIFTYLTRLPADRSTPVLYNGDRLWAKVTLVLETAGPVAVGQQANLYPVLGGTGVILTVDEPYEVIIAKGTRLYIASNSINRVKVKIEPLPWMEQITGLVGSLLGRLVGR